MKIKKKSILRVFGLFSDVYAEFDKRIDTEEKLKSMVDNWVEIFEVLNFDYEEANDDFLQASKLAIIKSKYIPTISEISDEMKNIYISKQEERKRKKLWQVLEIENQCKMKSGVSERDNIIELFVRLEEKYTKNDIIEIIKRYRKREAIEDFDILDTTTIFREILEGNIE